MKKIFCIFLITLMVTISGCSSNQSGAQGVESQTTESQSQILSSQSEFNASESKTSESSSQDSVAEFADPFASFESGLNRLGLKYEIVTMAAELVGAETGKKYKLESGQIELYVFDEQGEAYKALRDSGEISLEGFGGFPAEVNGKFALLIEGIDDVEDILNLFKNLK